MIGGRLVRKFSLGRALQSKARLVSCVVVAGFCSAQGVATSAETPSRALDATNMVPIAFDAGNKQTLTAQCGSLYRLLKVPMRDACDGVIAQGVEVARSHLGRPIFALRTGAPLTDKSATRVLILGAVHGDELTSGWLSLKWAAFAPPMTEKRTHSVLHVPIVNPDGVFGARPSRTNGRGVDLNRNFPTPQWNPEANRWWVNKTKRDPRRFPGHAAASEFETKYIMRVIETFKPTVVVSVHAPLGVLDYDGGGPLPERIGSIFLDSLGIYPGSLGHFGSRSRGVPVLTVELPHAINPVSTEETKRMWRDLFAWIDKYANYDSQSK